MSLLKDALRGSDFDFTAGPLGRAVLLLAIPMVLETVLESLFAVVDIFWVSRLGPAAVAAVGLTESLLSVIYALAMGLGIGVTALVARRMGEQRPEAAARATAQALLLGTVAALVLGTAGAVLAPRLLALMGAEPAVVATGAGYTRVMLGGEATVILLFLMNAAFRGAGDAAIAMRVLWTANAVNLVLDPILIFGLGPIPALGVTGAAVATTTGRGIGVLVQLWALWRGRGRLAPARADLTPDPATMGALVRLSATGTLQMCVGMLSWIVLVRILAGFGSVALAGYTIAIRLVIFALFPSWGLSNAAATLVGQALGARRPERAVAAVRMAGRYNFWFLFAVGVLFVAGAPWLVARFTADAAVAAQAVACLRVVGLGFPIYAWGMVLTQAFNGAGDTWTPTWLNLLCFWILELPLAWALAHPAGIGPLGVYAAIPVAFSTLAVASWALFRRGRWQQAAV